MRRRDILRPELMAVRPVPVSAWPSIADIPIGAPVLDSDGVIKRCGDVSGSIWQTRTSAADNGWRALTECTSGAWAGRLVAVSDSGIGNRVMTSDLKKELRKI